MHIDARTLENNTIIEGDICIVGSGAAGLSMALDWLNTGHKVILLESGGFEYENRVQDLGQGTSSGQTYYPLRACRLRYFGGTTGHWAGMCSPFDNIDFVKRDWVPHSGWPISRQDLDPYYERAHKVLQLGPYIYELSHWQQTFPTFEALPLDQDVIWNKMWQFSQARYIHEYKDTIVQASNIHLYTHANVINIEANESVSSINRLEATNYAGNSFSVKAKQYVLACGSIQNARLLLASNQQAPNGIGNDHDNVGRYFMEHLEVACAQLWLNKAYSTDLFKWPAEPNTPRAELAITEQTQIAHKILNGTSSFASLAGRLARKSRMEIWQDQDSRKNMENMKNMYASGHEASQQSEGPLQRAYQLSVRIEQAPNPNSRISLGTDKDEFGVPLVHLHWDLTELDKRSIRTIYQIIGQQVGIAGIGRVRLDEFLREDAEPGFPDSTNGGWHHMGTTRMSDAPQNGVVDANCQVHGLSNLFVAGAGCYSTSGAPNPTLTLVALSLRLSDYLKGKLS
ncbi:MAG: GMC family oxidoreductase [Bacteroidota bacterium]